MRAISLCQPYATLVAIGAKKIETRSWHTRYRGPLLIHAAKSLDMVGGLRGLLDCFRAPLYVEAFAAHMDAATPIREVVPLGAIVGIVRVVAVGRIGRSDEGAVTVSGHEVSGHEVTFGDYRVGHYGWVLINARRLETPIPCRGARGLWTVPPEIVAQLPEAWRRECEVLAPGLSRLVEAAQTAGEAGA